MTTETSPPSATNEQQAKMDSMFTILLYLPHVPPFEPSTPQSEIRRLMTAFTISQAVAIAKHQPLLERDLPTLIPKQVRKEALYDAVQAGLLAETVWKGEPAWMIPPPEEAKPEGGA